MAGSWGEFLTRVFSGGVRRWARASAIALAALALAAHPAAASIAITDPHDAPPAPALIDDEIDGQDAPALATVRLESRPAALLTGEAPWEDAYGALARAGTRLAQALAAAGIAPAGRPRAAYLAGDDEGFGFEVILPLARAPTPEEASAARESEAAIVFGRTRGGFALRAVHEGPYAEIDATYEALTAALDREGLIVEDVILEEFLTQARDEHDPSLRVAIYLFPK